MKLICAYACMGSPYHKSQIFQVKSGKKSFHEFVEETGISDNLCMETYERRGRL